jgi:hypothetical protein
MAIPIVIHSPVIPIYRVVVMEFAAIVPFFITPVVIIAMTVFVLVVALIATLVLGRTGITPSIVCLVNG